MMYTYKDHEYKLSPVILLGCCWDKRTQKPTSLFWALFCIVSFATIHWYFSAAPPESLASKNVVGGQGGNDGGDGGNGNGVGGFEVDLNQQPENPKFKALGDQAQGQGGEKAQDPEDDLRHIEEENAPQVPELKDIFVRDWHREKGNERHPPLGHNEHRPEPKDFPVPIMNSPACGTEVYSVIILVEDSPDNTGGRLAIRSTWGMQDAVKYPNIPPQSWRTVFIMGRLKGRNADYFNSAVVAESKKYGDILQGDFEDNAHESTRKFMMALRWLNENQDLCKTKFVLKTRGDIFLNMNSITEWLTKRWGPDENRLYVGRILKNDVPIRNSADPLYVSHEDYPKDFFPNFIEGPVFLFDWLAFERLFAVMDSVTPIAMDDSYVGLLAEKALILPQHNDHFQLIKPPDHVCAKLKIFFMNKLLPKEHIELFNTIKSAQVKNLCPDAKIIYHREGGGKKRVEI